MNMHSLWEDTLDDAHGAFINGDISEDEFVERLRGIGFDEDEVWDWVDAAWEDRREIALDNSQFGVGS